MTKPITINSKLITKNMYEYITGKLTAITPTTAIIEAAGIGYCINISLQSYSAAEKATDIKLYLHQYIVQNDAPVFYGFATTAEREMFRLLISVSGIGANTARIMLSSFSTEELVNAIATGNVAAIKSVKGIGIKTAERTILELKGKVLNVETSGGAATGFVSASASENLQEAIEALLVLGFNKAAVEKTAKALYNENPTMAAEEIIRGSLSRL